MKAAAIFMLIACTQSIWAADLEQIRTASFENFSIDIKTAAAEMKVAAPEPASAPVMEDFTWRRDFCWTRGKEANADRMGMPATFCINSMSMTGAVSSNPRLSLEGSVTGVFDVKLGPMSDGLVKATARIFDRTPMIQVCAPAESAYIEFIVLIDERGKIVSDPDTKSFYASTPDTCTAKWDVREIKYLLK